MAEHVHSEEPPHGVDWQKYKMINGAKGRLEEEFEKRLSFRGEDQVWIEMKASKRAQLERYSVIYLSSTHRTSTHGIISNINYTIGRMHLSLVTFVSFSHI